MALKDWERRVLDAPGAAERVADIEAELRLAAGLTALREAAGLSQRDLAGLLGISQPRVAAIERSKNVTVDVLVRYISALGGSLEIVVAQGNRRVPLLAAASTRTSVTPKATGVAKRPVRPVRGKPAAARPVRRRAG